MKVLILSTFGNGVGIGCRLAQEDAEVKLWTKTPIYNNCGNGIITRVAEWRPHITWADLVVCDGPGLGHLEDVIKGFGKPMVGCSALLDLIVEDRGKMRQILDKVGQPCSNDPDGIDVSIEGWFNGRDWMHPFFITFNDRRMMDKGLGLNVGCAGCVTIAIEDSALVDRTIKQITKQLQKIGYRGAISMSCNVTEDSISPKGCVPGFCYDTIFTILEATKDSTTDLLFEVASGVRKEIQIGRDYIISVKVSVPPWPFVIEGMTSNEVIEGLNDQNLKHVFLGDVELIDDQYRCAGGDGMIARITARGRTVHEARNRAYRTIGYLNIPNVQYRTDIGVSVDSHIEQLRTWRLI